MSYINVCDTHTHTGSDDLRRQYFTTCAADRPLIAQLGARNADEFLAAAVLLQPYVDAIELNLGCPQRRAKVECFG